MADVDEIGQDASDAAALEHAERVLRRRYDFRAPGIPQRIRFTVYTLHAEAQLLRGECGSV